MSEKKIHSPIDLNLTWLLQHLGPSFEASFTIDRSSPKCRTPRRNPDIDAAQSLAKNLSVAIPSSTCLFYVLSSPFSSILALRFPDLLPSIKFSDQVVGFFTATLPIKKFAAKNDNMLISDVNEGNIFLPVMPVFLPIPLAEVFFLLTVPESPERTVHSIFPSFILYSSPHSSQGDRSGASIPTVQAALWIAEERRTLSVALGNLDKTYPPPEKIFSCVEAKVRLFQHMLLSLFFFRPAALCFIQKPSQPHTSNPSATSSFSCRNSSFKPSESRSLFFSLLRSFLCSTFP